MRLVPAFGVISFLFACGRSDPVPQSYYFAADSTALQRKLDEMSSHYPWVEMREVRDNSAPIDHAHLIRYRWAFAGIGWFEVRLRGKRLPGNTRWPICSIEIGPGVARRPFPVQKIYTLFDDAALAHRVEAAVGQVDIKRPYEIEVVVDGFRVWLEQFAGSGGPTVNVVIDGCGRVAPRKLWREVREDVPELTFPDPPIED